MRKFETLLLLSPELSADTREGTIAALTAIIEREKGVMFCDSLHNLQEILRFLPLHPVTLRVCAFFLLARIRNANFFLAIR